MSRSPRPLDVAIIGMSCRFAGADDLFAYWRDVIEGRSSVRAGSIGVREDDACADFKTLPNDGRCGGYLDDVILLDGGAPAEMPGEAEGGDPGRLLVLDAARSALLDAGLGDGFGSGRRVGVVVGRGRPFDRGGLIRLQHGRVLEQTLGILETLHPEWSAEDREAVRADLSGSLPTIGPRAIPGGRSKGASGLTRVRFGALGPGIAVDAGGASALVALGMGASSVASGRADLGIVGAVHIETETRLAMGHARPGAVSRSGNCRPFSAEADGLVPGEGVGVVILKRLREAERDGDRIYAVLTGVGLAGEGRGLGPAGRDASCHLRAMRRAYRRSGVEPGTVGLVEGHGLGVPSADRAELRALRAAFPPVEPGRGRMLGAASALVGHARPASGMAGLIKAALALHHRVLPATPDAGAPHPLLSRDDGPLSINHESRPWINGHPLPRRAAVNAFEVAGISAHAVLEAHPSSDDEVQGCLVRWPDEAILLAADDRSSLIDRLRWLGDRLRRRPDLELKDLASALNREATARGEPVRLGLVARSIPDLIDRLDLMVGRLAESSRVSIRDGRGAYFWGRPAGEDGGLAFLFPGEGSQSPGMLADLCMNFPEVRGCFDQIDRMALASGAIEPPGARLFGPGAEGDPTLWEAGTAVHVVLGSQWALYRLLSRLGLRPDAICGHSSGELPALVASGAIPEDGELERRLNEMASVFSGLERSGMIPEAGLLGVGADRDRVGRMLGDLGGRVRVVADNCPHQVVMVGSREEIGLLSDRLEGEGIPAELLPFSRAYHTPAFEPAMGPIRSFFKSIPIGPPAIPLYSCCAAARMPGDGEAVRRLAVDQWTRPVEFRRTVEAMYADGIRVFVDVGARGNLAGYVEDTLRGRAAFAVAANLPRRSGLSQLNHLVASLFAQGVRIDPAVLHARRRTRPVDLDAEPEDRVGKVPLRLGFPEMRLSESLARRLRDRPREGEPGDRGWPDVGERVSGHGPLTADSGFESFGDHPGDCPPGLGLGGLGCRRPDEPSGAGDVTTPSRRSGGADAGPQEDVEPVPAGLPAGRWSLSDDRDIDQAEWVEGSFRGPDRALSLDTSSGVRVISPGRWSQPADWEGLGAIETDRRDRDVQVSRRVLDARGDPVAENHAFGGRRLSAVDPGLKGLPVLPFTVMAEMLAEAAGRLVPGGVLVGLRSVRARRWIAYQDEPILLEFVAERDPDRPGEVRAGLYNRGPADRPEPRGDRPDVEAVAAFSARRAEPPEASPVDLGGLEPSRFTAESLYGEQWLFHGPALRGLAGVGGVSDRGIEGTLRVLPRRALRRDPDAPAPLTDPIVLDAFTHLLGCWGLDRLAEGDVIFPLGLGRLELFGEDPPEGTDVSCRIEVREVEPHRVRANAEIVRPDGRVWMRLSDWEDWRFYWPPRYRDVFRMPDRVLLAEPVALPGGPPDALAVWLQPPEDMGRPVWRDVLERVQLSPEERSGCLRPEGSDRRRTLRLWGRVAAKEAVRRLWLAEGRGAVYPADLVIEPDPAGRPVLRPRLEGGHAAMPCVSISHTDGVAVALACRDVGARIGIDVERIMARSGAFEELAFVPGERALLDGVDAADRPEWIARLWCAREAVAKATGLGMVDGPRSVEALEVDRETGVVIVRLGPALAAACPGLAGLGLVVCSSTRDGYAWAWIVRKGGER